MPVQDSIATLRFHDRDQPLHSADYYFLPQDHRQCLRIGRKDVRKLLHVTDPTISNHHLELHCVVYDEYAVEASVPAMLYVRNLSSNPTYLLRSPSFGSGKVILAQHGEDVLLNQQDRVYMSPRFFIEYLTSDSLPSQGSTQSERSTIVSLETREFSDRVLVTNRRLGEGGSAGVFVAIERKTNRQLACKVLPVPRYNTAAGFLLTNYRRQDAEVINDGRGRAEQQHKLAMEHQLIARLSHPNIIRLERVICTTFNIYIFQELITGGDLYSHIERNGGAFSEAQTVVIVRQLLDAIAYLHDQHIVHRDIKPENILVTSWRPGARVVLADFGHAVAIDVAGARSHSSTLSRMHTIVGTKGYLAPEVYLYDDTKAQHPVGYTSAVDLWAIGCVTATCLTGELVFTSSYDFTFVTQRAKPISSSNFSRHFDLSDMEASEKWSGVSGSAKDFVRRCLDPIADQRPTARQALEQPWFCDRSYWTHLEEAYKRAVAGRTPRSSTDAMVEEVDTTAAVHAALNGTSTSSYFERSQNTATYADRLAQMDEAGELPPPGAQPVRGSPEGQSVSQPEGWEYASPVVPESPPPTQSTIVDNTQQLSILKMRPPIFNAAPTQEPAYMPNFPSQTQWLTQATQPLQVSLSASLAHSGTLRSFGRGSGLRKGMPALKPHYTDYRVAKQHAPASHLADARLSLAPTQTQPWSKKWNR